MKRSQPIILTKFVFFIMWRARFSELCRNLVGLELTENVSSCTVVEYVEISIVNEVI